MRITNRNQIIDKETIFNGCNKLEEAFKDFTQCAKLVNEAAITCSPKALSVENSSMQPVLEDLADNFFTYEKSIKNVVEAIKKAVERQYNKELAAYQDYLAQIKKEQEAAEKAAAEANKLKNSSGTEQK